MVNTDATLEAELEKACSFLTDKHGVRKVWLFGSAAKGRQLDWRSDLDLAVESMAKEELCRTWSELDCLLGRAVDLVRLEEASPILREEILRWGKVLYEA